MNIYLKLHYGKIIIMKFVIETNGGNIPSEFTKIITDFTNDLRITFPEYNGLLLKYTLTEDPLVLYNHVGKVVIENYKDIVSKNVELFQEGTTKNTEFLPRIMFHYLWNSDLSNNTHTTLWNYLTLLFVTFAKNSVDDIEDDMPSALKGMMGGSLGKLAMELAKETISSGGSSGGPSDIFGMMSKIGTTIDSKIKSGEISENDLLEESMNMMNSFGPGNMSAMMNMFKKPDNGSGISGLDMSPLENILNGNKLYKDNERRVQKTNDKKHRQNMRSKNPRNMADINSNESPEYTLPRFTDEELEKIFASK